ncbi:hypothetical protein [Mesoterricola silvestris]|uniref:hypothetical protein n=1 Tax=Mesoterricola silvestris TaxID=2927979 RepID=UPI00292EFF51|nr:hypothetical protein [Mesoterricola silvestris]
MQTLLIAALLAAPALGAPLVEAFQKGPIAMTARVVRGKGTPEEAALPLFRVPVLRFGDDLELGFAGEAFDQRVTRADWSLIVVFLPRTVAPTDQGVVDFRLKRKGEHMSAPAIPVPYDSIPMIFLIPDKNGRKKVLTDLNAHLGAFRTLCAKISDLSGERATADAFLEELGAIDKNLSAAQYDNAVLSFLHTYGGAVSGDLQAFVGGSRTNLDKFQFLTQEFRKTNVLVPEAVTASPVEAQVAVGTKPSSAYVSIFFDLAAIVKNLWPGHQFNYLPALARNFHGDGAELYYSDWIHTTGDTRGALLCCPGKWEDLTPPAFGLELAPGESMLKGQAALKVLPKEKGRTPFALYGQDWKLVVAGLPPLALASSPANMTFVASCAPLQEPLRKLGAPTVKVKVVGRWGFTSMATDPVEVPVAVDPAWAPTPVERQRFQVGGPCSLKLPAAWAGVVEKVVFRPAGAPPLTAQLKDAPDGGREAVFQTAPAQAGAGALEVTAFGQPARTLPLVLLEAPPQPAGLEARLGEVRILLKGRHLEGVKALELAERRFLPDGEAAEGRWFKAEDTKPLEGSVGRSLPAALVLATGKTPAGPAVLLPPRPRLADLQTIPMEGKGTGLPMSSALPIAPTGGPSLVTLLTAKGYRFPPDGAVHAALRNAEDPGVVRVVPAPKIRLLGNNQKATFVLNPAELLGGRAAGRLEVQIQDASAGASDWLPLPVTFLDLPTITAVQAAAPGLRLVGPSLDQIEAVAPTATGPWEKAAVLIQDGRETLTVPSPPDAGVCYLKVFGWPDRVLTLKFPPVKPPAEPGPS